MHSKEKSGEQKLNLELIILKAIAGNNWLIRERLDTQEEIYPGLSFHLTIDAQSVTEYVGLELA